MVLAVEISHLITANGRKLKSKFLIGIFLVLILSVFPFHFVAKADYAPVSSGTLNLSAEFGSKLGKR